MAKTASNQPKRRKYELKKEQVIAMHISGYSQPEIAKKIGVAKSTVCNWLKKYKAEDPNGEIERARDEKKKEFVNQSWDIISKSMSLMNRRVTTAIEKEEEIDELIYQIGINEEISEAGKKDAIGKLRQLQIQSMRDMSVVVGTLYDKQALAQGESTQNISGLEVNIKVVD